MEVIPKYASSVILIRKNSQVVEDADFEVLMIKRSETMKFLGGFHAFPGGKLKDSDYHEKNLKRCKGLDVNQAYNILNDQNTSFKERNIALSFWVTAIREVFEEIGILIAYKNDKLIDLSVENEKSKYQKYRQRLIEGNISLLDVMEIENLFFIRRF